MMTVVWMDVKSVDKKVALKVVMMAGLLAEKKVANLADTMVA